MNCRVGFGSSNDKSRDAVRANRRPSGWVGGGVPLVFQNATAPLPTRAPTRRRARRLLRSGSSVAAHPRSLFRDGSSAAFFRGRSSVAVLEFVTYYVTKFFRVT